MGSKYKSVNEAKEALRAQIDKALDEKGSWTKGTCPTGEPFGWDMNIHYALEWFERHCPENWNISKIYRHECYDWTITER